MTMPKNIAVTVACLTFCAAPLGVRAENGAPFHFTCNLGPKAVRITTEGGRLVYRYGPLGRAELVIREDLAEPNVFHRRDMVGLKGEGQQLRFVNGQYSYALSSLFIAAAGGTDEVRFFVLRGDRVVLSRRCGSAPSFEDYDELDRLPRDFTKPLDYSVP